MIEKVEIITNMQPQTELEKSILRVFNGVATKLNEVIDAVNGVLAAQEQYATIYNEDIAPMLTPENEEPTDPYAEQRRWIGCVCRFWYDNPNDTLLDYLDKIQTGRNGVVQYYSKESGDWFPHCEPVLPTDNAIYKGGNNE